MNSRTSWQCAVLVGAIGLVGGCERDPGSVGRPGDRALAPNESGQPAAAADRDPSSGSIRPPTTTQSPAAPGGAVPPAATPRLMARAEIEPLGDNIVRGMIEFQTAANGDGPVTVNVMLMGLDAGPHGMHIHMGTDCANTGMHLNPQDAPHGPANAGAAARHLGDLGNITADASGMVDEMLRDAQLGSDATFLGKVIVVHRNQDDLSTQPDGKSGEQIACGVIQPAEPLISRGDDPNRGV
jgi:Cu-Zn family superoxide dismutase